MQNAEADDRFTVTVTAERTVELVLGRQFTEADIDALVAAENAVRAAIPAQRSVSPN